ncbi:MAG: hypothetical protein P8J26_08365, partial [Pseudomonadales bacterium]|nr:hypothetical protein [Pseudomonadales bacterium]
MIVKAFKTIFGTRNDRQLKRMQKVVRRVNALAEQYSSLTDQQLRDKTDEFKTLIEGGSSLEDLLP